ncbi:MAG: arsenate reductase ArsC, partial [Bacteroidales bacterium]|nr:arsenate reductase ArsC [Bacteroidales bacterium]
FLQSFDSSLQVYSAGTEPAERVNPNAIKVMSEVGIDISLHTPKRVDQYIMEEWEYVITVCGGANENCPVFTGKVKQRWHLGYDDPAEAIGTDEVIIAEFRKVRDEIMDGFYSFYKSQIKGEHTCGCGCCG